jgi:hypothetical protein
MNKLKLRLEDLRIDSFSTEPVRKEKGTVFGEQCTCYTNCSCPGCPTCDASCNGTCNATACGSCGASCGGTCDYSCDYSCGGTCGEYGCATYATYGGGREGVCDLCAGV